MFGTRGVIGLGALALVVAAASAAHAVPAKAAVDAFLWFETPSVVDPIHTYGEPDVAMAPNGGVFASGPWGTGTQHSIWNASVDGGHTFRIVSQGAPPPNSGFGIDSPPGGGDTDINFDRASKQYFIDLAAAECIRTETTTNAGGSTSQNIPGSCVGPNLPGADRQWYAVYDPAPSTPNRSAYTGPKPLIYLEYAAAVSAALVAVNSHTQWEFSNTAVDSLPGGPGLQFSPAFPVGTSGPYGFRGYPAIDQVTGKVFESGSGTVQLNIGTPQSDGALCFLDTALNGGNHSNCPAGPGLLTIDNRANGSLLGTVLSMDSGRNLWAVYDSGHHIYVNVTPPDNDKWDQWRTVASAPSGFQVSGNLPNDQSQVFPWIKGGGPGMADVVWYGMDQAGDPSAQNNQKWNVFMSQVLISKQTDGTSVDPAAVPTIHEVQVSPHPVHYNDICLNGTGCLTNTPPGNRNLADFFQVNIDSTGAAEVVYDDTSNRLFQPGTEPGGNTNADHNGAALVTLARQAGGPGLFGTNVSGPTNTPITGLSDPTGDALFPVIAGGLVPSVNVPGMDLLGSSLSLSGSTLTVTMPVLNLLNSSGTAGAVAAPNLQYITRWQMGDVIYYAGMADNPSGQGRQFYAGQAQSIDLCSVSGCTPHVQIYPEGVVSSPTPTVVLGHPETGQVSCPSPGPPTPTNPCTITISVNTADVGAPGANSLLEEVGAYSFAAAHPQAELTNAQAQVDNTPLEIDGVCCYNFKASQQPCSGCIPEAPWTPALIAAGVALVGVGVYRRRRNSRSASFIE